MATSTTSKTRQNSAGAGDATRWLDAREQKAWRALMLTTHLLDETLDRQLQRDAGMPHAYYGLLVRLSEAPERTMRMGELASWMHYSQSRLTHAVTSMERSGWVARRSCPTDRRSQLVTLLDAGLEALRVAAPGHVAEVRAAVFDKLSAAQVEQLREICEVLLVGLSER